MREEMYAVKKCEWQMVINPIKSGVGGEGGVGGWRGDHFFPW